MLADERERLILAAAVPFFAEHGFEGHTRELAKRIGIAQPLLYRYFPSKEALMDRVFQEVFVGRWNPQWENWISDRSQPLEQRLLRFCQDFARMVNSYEWIRLVAFASLKGLDFPRRIIGNKREQLFTCVVEELRYARDLPSLAEMPMTEMERELSWGLQAAIYYLGVRRWQYSHSLPENLDDIVAVQVAVFLRGAPATMAALLLLPRAAMDAAD